MKYLNLFIVVSLQGIWIQKTIAENASVCKDLAKFAVIPGTSADGTGQIKSDELVQDKISKYAHVTETLLKTKIEGDPILKNLSQEAFGKESGTSSTVHLIQRSALGDPLQIKIGDAGTNFQRLDDMLQKPAYQKILRDYKKIALKSMVEPEITNKAKSKIFPKVKALIVARIHKLNMPEPEKLKLLEKINSVQFESLNCDSLDGTSTAEGSPISSKLAPNAFLNGNTLRYWQSGLQSTSEFEIAFSLAHEIAQSIAPANINGEDPLKNLSKCLSDAKSLHSSHDPYNQAIPDWFATEILPEYIEDNYKSTLTLSQVRNGYANVFRSRGPLAEDLSPETHLATRTLYNQLILAHPKIRAQMGCTDNNTSALYCDGDTAAPRNSSIPNAVHPSTEKIPGAR
jgi:hypothetical protein